MIKKSFNILLFVLLGVSAQAQEVNKEKEESNLQKYTPAILFQPGDWNLLFFNSIYSQTKISDRDGNKLPLDHRASFLNSFLEFSIGIHPKINIGAEIRYNRTAIDPADGSLLQVLSNSEGISYRSDLTLFGPKIRWQPFQTISTFSIQSTFLLPIAKSLESPIFINHDRYQWYTQLFYDHAFSSKFRTFIDIGILYQFNRNSSTSGDILRLPISLFLNYFPLSKVSLFGFIQYSPLFSTISNETTSIYGLTAWYTQLGLGVKYQILPKLGFDVSYGNLILSRNEGAGSNINFGMRFIH